MGFGEGNEDKETQRQDSRSDSRHNSASSRGSRRRSLYRQGSLCSQLGEDVVPLNDIHSIGTQRSRTASGRSIRSRKASRAEYHEDLKPELKSGLTKNLLLTAFAILFGSSFLFGFNIGVLNQPALLIKVFYNETYVGRGSPLDQTKLTLLWSLTTALFIPGGMIGAFSAGFMADRFGRKYATMLSHIPAFIGAIVSCCCVAANSPELLMLGRFITGINCGFATQLAPMYLMEITPFNLRGAFGTANQLFITIGIFMGSVFGLRELLGTTEGWPYILLLNAIPALVSLIMLPFLPDSPRYLMLKKNDRIAAEKALRFLRQRLDVMTDIEEMETELHDDENKSEDESYTMARLFKTRALWKPLFVACMLQVIQQLSGINAIFFYSNSIYDNAGVAEADIQYAVLGTSAVNVAMTIVAVPIMDIAGRRKLLLYPMVAMVFILALITAALNLQDDLKWMSYISIICVLAYVICFAVGLGPIPMMIGAELFRQGPRPRAMSIVGFTNWLFTMVVALTFELIQEAIGEYTFIIFLVLMVGFTAFVFFLVPETKNKTFEEIASVFQPGGDIEVEEVIEDGVFGDVEEQPGEVTKLMGDKNSRQNGSAASLGSKKASTDDVRVKVDEERRSLTKSAENIHNLEV